MRRAGKIDDNQRQIVEALRKAGAFVQPLAAVGSGVSDLLCGYGGHWHVLEVKDGNKPPSARKLTPDQIKWILDIRNRAPVHVVETVDQAVAVVRGGNVSA